MDRSRHHLCRGRCVARSEADDDRPLLCSRRLQAAAFPGERGDDDLEDDDPDDNIPLADLAWQLNEAGASVTEEAVAAFVGAEEEIPTAATLTDKEIAADIISKDTTVEDTEEPEEPEEPVEPPMTLSACLQHLERCRRYFLQQPDGEDLLKQLTALQVATEKTANKKKQSKIDSFFKKL